MGPLNQAQRIDEAPMLLLRENVLQAPYRGLAALLKVAFAMSLGIGLSACSQGQAPSFLLFDSFFPSWLVGIFVAVPITLVLRVILLRIGIDEVMPFRLLTYVCICACIVMAFSFYYSPR